jgi:outer membrane protein, multidrug efflux system
MKIATLPIMISLLVLTGCMVGPNYKAPTDAQLGIPQHWSTSLPGEATQKDLSAWWEQLNDPVLSDLVQRALKNGLDLQLAQARLREARARRALAGGQLFPTISASAISRRDQTIANSRTGTSFNAAFDATWEADIFGGLRRGVQAAQAELEATTADLYNTQVSFIAELALNYIELRAFQARIAIAKSNLDTQSETLQLTEWRAEAGLTSSVDVEQARTNREQTAAAIPSLQTGLAEARHRIEILLGKAPGSLPELENVKEIPAVPANVISNIPTVALAHRPDVRAAERRLAAETARIGQAEAQRYPGLNLAGSIGVDLVKGAPVAAAGELIASLAQTIFDGGKLRAQVEIQNAIQQQAMITYQSTVLTALEDVENALVSLERSRERLASLQTAAESARNAALLAREQYESGLTDFQTVLDTQRSVLNVEDSLTSTKADESSALIQLYKALGGGWDPRNSLTLNEVNNGKSGS